MVIKQKICKICYNIMVLKMVGRWLQDGSERFLKMSKISKKKSKSKNVKKFKKKSKNFSTFEKCQKVQEKVKKFLDTCT